MLSHEVLNFIGGLAEVFEGSLKLQGQHRCRTHHYAVVFLLLNQVLYVGFKSPQGAGARLRAQLQLAHGHWDQLVVAAFIQNLEFKNI